MVRSGLLSGMTLSGVLGLCSLPTWASSMVAPSGKRPMTFADLQRVKRISDPQVSASGKWVMFSVVDVDLERNTKISHLWVVPLAGGTERQLTFWKEGESDARFSPDGKQVAFVATDNAVGLSQIFLAPWDETAGLMGLRSG